MNSLLWLRRPGAHTLRLLVLPFVLALAAPMAFAASVPSDSIRHNVVAPSSMALGDHTLLLIRIDFSDTPGEVVSVTEAQRLLDTGLAPFFYKTSLGAFRLTSTVSASVYRMPAPASSYTSTGDRDGLHAAARDAAAADYTLSNYDFIMVVFPRLDSATLVGSGFEFGGLGDEPGSRTWINGHENFVVDVLAHELGHNLGLSHANSLLGADWPIDFSTSLEYGDTEDTMGAGRGFFNPAMLSQLGWLTTSDYATVTGSQTLRLRGFPQDSSAPVSPLALRFDGAPGFHFWAFVRQGVTGTGVCVVATNDSYHSTSTLLTDTFRGLSLVLGAGDYYSDLGTATTISVDAIGYESGIPYADCTVTVPSSPGFPQLASPPSLTSAIGGSTLHASFTTPGDTVTWEKLLTGAAAWVPVVPSDVLKQSGQTDITFRRNTGIADVRLVASNGHGTLISNPVRIVANTPLEPSILTVGADAQRYFLGVHETGPWHLSVSDSWISVSQESGSGPQQVLVSVTDNDSGSVRTATVSVGAASHTLNQAAANPGDEIYAVGSVEIGPEVLSSEQPIRIGSDFTGMTTPGIFQKTDGTRWFVARQLMKFISADWMTARRGPVDRGAGIGVLRKVPSDVVAFANDRNNGSQYTFLKSDGTVYWNQQTFSDENGVCVARAVGSGAEKLACGSTVAAYIDGQGALWAWGKNYFGEVGDGTLVDRTTPVQVATGATTISCATHQHWFLTGDGTLNGVGKQCYSTLGTPQGFDTNVAEVAAGGVHTIILRKDGTVWAVGRNAEGQLGDGSWTPREAPVQVAAGIAHISTGLNTSYLLGTDGVLYSFGWNQFGTLGDGTTNNRNRPVPIAKNVTTLFENLFMTADGGLWATGGSLSIPSRPQTSNSGWVRAGAGAIAVAATHQLSWYLDSAGNLFASGMPQDGDGPASSRWLLIESDVQSLAPGCATSDWLGVIKRSGEVIGLTWTFNFRWARLRFPADVATVAFGGFYEPYGYALRKDATLWRVSWMVDTLGGTGAPTFEKQIASSVASVTCDPWSVHYVDTEGTLKRQMIGDGSTMTIAANVTAVRTALFGSGYFLTGDHVLHQVFASGEYLTVAPSVADFSASYEHVLFRTLDGNLWGMGRNASGQLGPASPFYATSPQLLARAATGYVAGYSSSLVIGRASDLVAAPANPITSNPVSLPTRSGLVHFHVGAQAEDLTYQWQYYDTATSHWLNFSDGPNSSGASSADLTLLDASALGSGVQVRCVVTMNGVSSYSSVATVTQGTSDARLVNLSARAALDSGQNVILGFVSSGAKDVLARAAGPSLGVFDLTGYMEDPTLQVHGGGGETLLSVDDWDSSLASVFAQVGAYQFPDGGKDAAAMVSVNGVNTVTINGAGSGIVLAEVYEVDTTTSAHLVNMSIRNRTGPGAETLIAGFVIKGTVAKQVLIRGIGPTLAVFGVTGTVADPSITVYQGQTAILSNDDWDPSLAPVFDQAHAFALDSGSKDAALLATLQPGAYTVQVTGPTSGEALVELYEVP